MPKKTLVTLIALLVVLFAFSAYAFVNRTDDDDDGASVAAESSTTTQNDATAPSNDTNSDSNENEDDDRDDDDRDVTTTPPAATFTESFPAGSYSMIDIATHNTESSCWAAVNSSVYDLTTWVSRHPGGSRAIVSMCGTNATSKFEAQHGGSRAAQAALVLLKIGTLTN